MPGRQRESGLGISCCGCCRLERVESRYGTQLRRLTDGQQRRASLSLVVMLVARVGAVGSGSVAADKGGSEWTLANVECVGVGRRGGGFPVAIDGEMERHQWITLFVMSARRRLVSCVK